LKAGPERLESVLVFPQINMHAGFQISAKFNDQVNSDHAVKDMAVAALQLPAVC